MAGLDEPVTVILLAAGESTRFRTDSTISKQFRSVRGRSVLEIALSALTENQEVGRIFVVTRECEVEMVERISAKISSADKVTVVVGGRHRMDSARLGFQAAFGDKPSGLLLIHDAARPYVTQESIFDNLFHLRAGADITIPYLPAVDTLAYDDAIIDRERIRLLQTPQGFRAGALGRAYEALLVDKEAPVFTDEWSLTKHYVTEAKAVFYLGHHLNNKITEYKDLSLLEAAAKKSGVALPPVNQLDCTGKRALVLGGKGSLGSKIAGLMRKAGAEVVIADLPEVDVKDHECLAPFEDGKPWDIVVHTVGFFKDSQGECIIQPIQTVSLESWRESQAVMLESVLVTGKFAAKHTPRGGHLLLVGSSMSHAGRTGYCLYAAAKAGVLAMSQSFAEDFAAQGIQVNCVCPGTVDTPLRDQLPTAARNLSRAIPPDDVAALMGRILASDNTGECFDIAFGDIQESLYRPRRRALGVT